MSYVLDLLRRRQMQQQQTPGAGVLGALSFPHVDPSMIAGSAVAQPASADAHWRDPTSAPQPSPPTGPIDPAGPFSAPQTRAPMLTTPKQQAGGAPGAPRTTAGPDLGAVVPGALNGVKPAPQSPRRLAAWASQSPRSGGARDGGDERGLGGFLSRLDDPVGGGGDLTNMDLLQMGLGLLGAGQASWDINSGDAYTKGARVLGETMANAEERTFRNEQREAWQTDRARDEERFGRERTSWAQEDEQRAAIMANIEAMPDGPEKEWARAHPEAYARVQTEIYGRPETLRVIGPNGEMVEQDRFGNQRGTGEFTAGGEREYQLERSRINAANAARERERRMTPGQVNTARDSYASIRQTRAQLQRVQGMLGRMNDAQLATQLGDANSAFMSALTQLQMSLKEQTELGALAGPDLALLRAYTGDPRDTVAFLRGQGARGMRGSLMEVERGLGLSENRWETTFSPYSEDPDLSDLFEQLRGERAQQPAGEQGARAPSAQQMAALRSMRDDPAAVAAFIQDFGVEAYRRALEEEEDRRARAPQSGRRTQAGADGVLRDSSGYVVAR